MKTKLLRMAATLAVMFFAVSTVARAQDQAGRRGGGRNQKAALLKDIQVDQATDAKIDSVLAKYGEQQRALMQEARSAGGQPDMAKVQDLQKKRNDEIRELLKEEQRKTFDANVEAMAAARRGGGGGTRQQTTI